MLRELGAVRACRSFTLAFASLAIALIVACAPGHLDNAHDPVLEIGGVHVGDDASATLRVFGYGTPAKREDLSGFTQDVSLFRHGDAVIAIAIRAGHIAGFVAYERLPDASVAHEFSRLSGRLPARTSVAIASLRWLGGPVFSTALPATPPGWRVPTDFTIASSDKQFLVTDGTHVASKTSSPSNGWVVEVR